MFQQVCHVKESLMLKAISSIEGYRFKFAALSPVIIISAGELKNCSGKPILLLFTYFLFDGCI
jgi:hypothetical protein